MSGYVFADQDSIEPIADSLGEMWGNTDLYNVVSGCGLTYDAADLTVDLAAGIITHFGSWVNVTVSANAFTLVSDPTNPRWTWLALSSAGAAQVVSGTPAATPAVPELGDRVALALILVPAGATIAATITYKLDKRIYMPHGPICVSITPATTILTASTALVTFTTDRTGVALSIPTFQGFRIVGNYRKTATAAQIAALGLTINATVVWTAVASANALAETSGTQQAEDGVFEVIVTPRSSANYLNGASRTFTTRISATGVAAAGGDGTADNLGVPMPNAAITSIIITGINNVANNNVEVSFVAVYPL